ncbi:hypothetical protein WH52_13475 [Tenacibaculum holothuriorum]|uniref:HMA domain-containing protein n=1 Tax=Tenacibaculum holothuriorum TaxID=1635173 RepID=A0A1Y2P9E8_9FLAO|nr:heavy metal-associated domain-containing protein [Tenacibaculum holothuriorum]OSY87066.1 hypothetical protein WH52_13475 [Tenacibaculum holothuriorum]
MKFLKIFYIVALVSFTMVSCKTEAKKENQPKKEEVAANVQEASFAISGMTCEIGCARKIAKDLSGKEGVLEAKVVFADSIAKVKFDANKTNKAELMAFVEGIGGDLYKTSEGGKKSCDKACAEKCDKEGDKKECMENCKKDCHSKKDEKTA